MMGKKVTMGNIMEKFSGNFQKNSGNFQWEHILGIFKIQTGHYVASDAM